MLNVALISGWHVHAGEYLGRINRNPDSRITAVWDEDPKRGQEIAKRCGAAFVGDYDALLADPTLDAVVITSPTNRHPELMIKAAGAGKHIFTEKVLAIDPADARAIREAVLASGVHFTICFPHQSEPVFLTLKEIVDSGKLGRITYAKFRKAHTGSVDNWLPAHFYDEKMCGGGAMMDLGAHPMYLLPWILGRPVSVTSVFTDMTGRGVEDNAVSAIEFEGGAIGVSETGFVSWGNPLVFEISGTDGWLLMTDGDLRYHTRTSGGWIIPDQNRHAPHPVDYFVESIVKNRPNTLYGIDEAVALTDLMAAAYRSARKGTREPV